MKDSDRAGVRPAPAAPTERDRGQQPGRAPGRAATETLPLDARLLSNAVIELNIARHILALYPREHRLVETSLDKTYAIFRELFELRTEITLAVAKDTLIVDGHHLEQKNPVYREFALALSRMSIAFVSFVKGVTQEEVYGFFRFLGRETAGLSAETLPDILAEYRLRHIAVRPLDYRAFAFAPEKTHRGRPDRYLLERHIKGLLDGGLPSGGVQMLVDGLDPATLAALLNQAGRTAERVAAYDTVVSSYLRSEAGRPLSGGDLQRLMTFIAGLRPELKQQFLTSSVRAFAGDAAAIGRALEGVSVDSIIEFLGELDRSRVALPESLCALVARFSRSGVELPGGGLNVDDVLLSREVAALFRQEQGSHVPAPYQAELRSLLEAPEAESSLLALPALEQEMAEEYVRYCHAQALLALLDSTLPGLITLEDQEGYAAAFIELARLSAASGQYGQLLELLTKFDELERRQRHPEVVRAVREFCRGAEFLAGLVDSFRRHGRGNRAGASLVCGCCGERIVKPLFDALAVEERMHVRKLLLGLLLGLREHAAGEARRRLFDGRWHVRRNALYLLAESGARCDPRELARLGADKDPRVRLELARCLVREGQAAGVRTLRELMKDGTGGVADAATAAAGALGVRELVPDLEALAKKPSGGAAGLRRRLRAVRTLGQVGGGEAAEALRGLAQLRLFLLPGEAARFRAEVRKALRRIEPRRGGAETP